MDMIANHEATGMDRLTDSQYDPNSEEKILTGGRYSGIAEAAGTTDGQISSANGGGANHLRLTLNGFRNTYNNKSGSKIINNNN